jgi:hypothetical protein
MKNGMAVLALSGSRSFGQILTVLGHQRIGGAARLILHDCTEFGRGG